MTTSPLNLEAQNPDAITDQLPTPEELRAENSASSETRGKGCGKIWYAVLGIVLLNIFILIIVLTTVVGEEADQESSQATDSSMSLTELRNRLAPFTLSHTGSEFDGTDFKYQVQVLKAMQKDTFLIRKLQDKNKHYSHQKLQQRYALACLYYATSNRPTKWSAKPYGEGSILPWTVAKQWMNSFSLERDECEWIGVICNPDLLVVSLELNDNRMSGHIPPEMKLLGGSLESLMLSDNPGLGGSIPSVVQGLPKLKKLYIKGTSYQGGVDRDWCTDRLTTFEVSCDKIDCPDAVEGTCCSNCK